MKKVMVLAAAAAISSVAQAGELLVHGLSWHIKEGYTENGVYRKYNNFNVGLGYATDGGWVTGFYHNSYNKLSIYFGRNWSWEFGPTMFGRQPEIGFTLVAATGYGHRTSLPLTPLAGFTGKVPLSEQWSALVTMAPVPYEQADGSIKLGVVGNLSLAYRF